MMSYWDMAPAIVAGDIAAIKRLYEAGILGNGQEALCLASANGQLPIVSYLHQSGCDLSAAGHRAMMLAAANGRLNVVRYLHEQGQDIGALDNLVIRAAAMGNQLETLKYLHRNGADLQACATCCESLVLSPAAQPLLTYLARNGVATEGPQLMALLQAIRTDSYAAIRKQIRDLDVGAYSGVISRVAAERGNPRIFALLHQTGCNVITDHQIAFRTAASGGHTALLIYLHNNGADLRAGDDAALKIAAENGHVLAVSVLFERGADIHGIDDETLELIRLNGHVRTFNYLTDSGLDAIHSHRSEITAVQVELDSAKPVYHPSKLWEFFNKVNLEQLRLSGLHGFKRTINQNYFNFLPLSLFDPQLSRLAKWSLLHPSLTFFKTKVFDPDVLQEDGSLLPADRWVFSLKGDSSGLLRITGIELGRTAQLALYRLLMAMLWDYTRAHDKLGLAGRLSEPRTGSPIEVYIGSKLVSQDLAHSILECNSILGAIDTEERLSISRVAEVGAGYGRLGHVLMQAVRCQYVVFDIPPGLLVSQWYLGETFPGKRIFRFRHFEHFEDIAEELAQADIAFFSANQIELFPEGYFDLTINISSLHELRPDQIDNLLAQTYRVTRHYVYLKQYKEYINPYDGLRILEDSYRLAPGWKHRYYRDDGVDSRFFETLIEREAAGLPAQVPRVPPAALNEAAPTVSVLLANYNHARYLPTALAGICGQNRPPLEIIVVDDGSTDDSIAVIEEFARRFPNIRLLRNSINRGQHYSIQCALLAAQGDYIVWAASDDLLLPDFLERSVAVLKAHPSAGVCFSRLGVFVDGTSEVRRYDGQTHGAAFDYGDTARLMPPEELKESLSRHYIWMSGNAVLARRTALLEISGFESRLKWHADWFAYYVVALRYGACVIPETLALMRERRDTYSRTGMENPREQSRVLKSLFDAIKSPKYRDLLPVFLHCPSLLGLFGISALYTAMRDPRHWDLVPKLGWWLISHYLLQVYSRTRHGLPARFHRWLHARRS